MQTSNRTLLVIVLLLLVSMIMYYVNTYADVPYVRAGLWPHVEIGEIWFYLID